MCGIAGILDFKNKSNNNSEIIKTITKSISHRGPDNTSYYYNTEEGVYLGHNRLSIIDLTPNGLQPMHSYNGRYILVFNGEIYNHLYLRSEINKYLTLNNKFIKWKGHSDTETLINSFDIFGVKKTLDIIEGMFSIALWDKYEQMLYLIRDFFGEKPLYYCWINGDFIFASELKAIKSHPSFRGEIDENAKSLYLNLNYIPSPFTIYKNVYKLSAASYLKLSFKNKSEESKIEINNWSTKKNIITKSSQNYQDNDLETNTNILNQKLKDTVSKFMISDVEIGVFLSSGVDSSIISSIANSISEKPIKTFTIGFENHRYDESINAKKIANYLKTDHQEKIFSKNDLLNIVPNLSNIYDEPFADSSQLPTILLSSMASDQVKVVLSGDGGDELFGGYNRYILSDKYLKFLKIFPNFSKHLLSKLIKTIPKDIFFLIEKFLNLTKGHNKTFIYENMSKISSKLKYTNNYYSYYLSMIAEWYGNEIILDQDYNLDNYFKNKKIDGLNNEELMMYIDSETYLTDDILCKVDRAAMGVSLETRVPMLDHRVVEFAWSLPLSKKIQNNKGKTILRNILNKYVPKSLIERPKMGFGVPIDSWLRGPLRDWAENLLDESRLSQEGFFDPSPIREKWIEHLSGRRNWQYHLWDILMFQAWLRDGNN